MTIDINLNYGYGRLSVREPFLIATDTPVVLAFKSDYALKDTMVKFSADDGSACSLRLKNLSEIEVPSKLVKAGTLSVEVVLIVKEKAVKRWTVEPIVFSEAETGFSGHPEFEDIFKRVCELAITVNNHTIALSEMQATISEMNETVSGIEDIVKDTLE